MTVPVNADRRWERSAREARGADHGFSTLAGCGILGEAASFGGLAGVTIRVPHEQTRLRTGKAILIMRPQLGQQRWLPAGCVTATLSFMGPSGIGRPGRRPSTPFILPAPTADAFADSAVRGRVVDAWTWVLAHPLSPRFLESRPAPPSASGYVRHVTPKRVL